MRCKFITTILAIALSSATWAASITYVCDAPQGTRVDYFAFNKVNLQNDTFLMSKDRASSIRPRLVLDENSKEVLFALDRMPADASTPSISAKMMILQINAEQISFAGELNGAPMLATYYPQISVLIYSQQSIWPGPDYKGARAMTFYAKCTQR